MTVPTTPSTITTLTAADPTDPTDPGTGNGSDLDVVAGLLATAFDEPVTGWLVPDPNRHHPVITGLFTLMAGDALAGGGWVDVLTGPDGQGAAAAIWFNHTTGEADRPTPSRSTGRTRGWTRSSGPTPPAGTPSTR